MSMNVDHGKFRPFQLRRDYFERRFGIKITEGWIIRSLGLRFRLARKFWTHKTMSAIQSPNPIRRIRVEFIIEFREQRRVGKGCQVFILR